MDVYEFRLWLKQVKDLRSSEALHRDDLPRARAQIQRFINSSETDKSRAFQYMIEPPSYIILSGCEGVRKLICDLDMPNNPDDVYYSLLARGGDLIKAPSRDYDRYTVEWFGLKTTGAQPDPSTYAIQPRYCRDAHQELVQIWRLRIFLCQPQELRTSESNPITADDTPFPYLEDIWHPNLSRTAISLHALINPRAGRSLLAFYTRLDNLPNERNALAGRPPGSGRRFRSDDDFFETMMDARAELIAKTNTNPIREAVAFKMDVAFGTFKDYWKRISRKLDLGWRDLGDVDHPAMHKKPKNP